MKFIKINLKEIVEYLIYLVLKTKIYYPPRISSPSRLWTLSEAILYIYLNFDNF
jgi:hypothetical protein